MTNQPPKSNLFSPQYMVNHVKNSIANWLHPAHHVTSYDKIIFHLSYLDQQTLFDLVRQALTQCDDVNNDIQMVIKIRLLKPLMQTASIAFDLSQATTLINMAINRRLFMVAMELFCDYVNDYQHADSLRLQILIESFKLNPMSFEVILACTPSSLLDAPITISHGYGHEWSLLHILANITKNEPHRIQSLKRLIDRLGPKKAHEDLSRKQAIHGKTGYRLLKREARATIMAHCQSRDVTSSPYLST